MTHPSKDPNPAIPFIVTNPALRITNSAVLKAHGASDQPGADKTDTGEANFAGVILKPATRQAALAALRAHLRTSEYK